MDAITITVLLVFLLLETQIALAFSLATYFSRPKHNNQIVVPEVDEEDMVDLTNKTPNTYEDYVKLFKEIV